MAEALVKVQIPDGWELACDEMRVPYDGEFCILGKPQPGMPSGAVMEVAESGGFPRVIVRRKWEWPAWLKAKWLFCDGYGHWFAVCCGNRPVYDKARDAWVCNFGYSGPVLDLQCGCIDFTPPQCDDWKTSLRRNPNIPGDD